MKLAKDDKIETGGEKKKKERKKERKNDFISLLSAYTETNLLSNDITVLSHGKQRHRKMK